MSFEIIDFHTHPFLTPDCNICRYKYFSDSITAEDTKRDLSSLGISKICGSVIAPYNKETFSFSDVKRANDIALDLKALYGDFYEVGFHVHPAFIRESCEEIERMHGLGAKIIGELLPYFHMWRDLSLDYGSEELSEILDLAEQYGMIVSLHTMDEEGLDKMVREHPKLTIVAAHPGEAASYDRHLARMKLSENYYLDLSGSGGPLRFASTRNAIDKVGVERLLFGSDYPTCQAGIMLGSILMDYTLTDTEKEAILSGNAKRLLQLD